MFRISKSWRMLKNLTQSDLAFHPCICNREHAPLYSPRVMGPIKGFRSRVLPWHVSSALQSYLRPNPL